jgi:hypothetical protein
MKYAIVNTKSNYRNLNGRRLKVVEDFSNFICCEFVDEGRIVRADFGKSEIVKIWEPVNIHEFIYN